MKLGGAAIRRNRVRCLYAATALSCLFISGTLLSGCHGGIAPGVAGAQNIDVVPISSELVAHQASERASARMAKANFKEPQEPSAPYIYRVGIGDILFIKLWEKGSLSFANSYALNNEQVGTLVDGRGKIYYPYAGEIEVVGKSLEEIRLALAAKLSQYFRNPTLEVTILEFRSQKISVTGEVKEPSVLTLQQDPLYVLDAIKKAGGVKETADLESAEIIRSTGEREEVNLLDLLYAGDMTENRIMRNGDVLQIPDNHRNKVFVMGEVKQQKAQTIHAGKMSLAEVLNDAEGLNLAHAGANNIYVLRGAIKPAMLEPGYYPRASEKPDGRVFDTEIYRLDASSADALVLADNFMLEPRDIVFVSTSRLTQWSRVIEQLIPNSVSIYANERMIEEW